MPPGVALFTNLVGEPKNTPGGCYKKAEMKVTIFIPGQTPSKKNSKRIVLPRGGGRRRVISSEFYIAWEKEALLRLRRSELIGYPWKYPLRAGFHYARETRAAFDYNNLGQGVADILVQVGIIKDDSMKYFIPNGDYSWEVNKDCPGVYITLEEVEVTNAPPTQTVSGSRKMQKKTASPNQGQGPEGAKAVAQHPNRNERVSVPVLRGRLGPGDPPQKKRRR
jgi:hypothetical protein